MASFFQSLFESIFTPGPTPTLLVATNVTFASLQLVLLVLLIVTYSVHFAILSGLCAGLWWAINWFARELKIHQEAEERQLAREKRHTPALVTSEESETEVEESLSAKTGRRQKAVPPVAKTAVTDVEPLEAHGEIKHRAAAAPSGDEASQGTKSSVSTEDEWEKVSENENEKDK